MIRLVTVRCTGCGRPHVASLEALANRDNCPFCGEMTRQTALLLPLRTAPPVDRDTRSAA